METATNTKPKFVLIRRHEGYPWDGNQATYLFFPVFASFVLVLLSNLSSPVIAGLSVVDVVGDGTGTVGMGAWGWCLRGSPSFPDKCAQQPAFGKTMEEVDQIGVVLQGLALFGDIPKAYLIANAAMHAIAAFVLYVTMNWSLAASGSWHKKEKYAWKWTNAAFNGTAISAVFILVAWALDLALITQTQAQVAKMGSNAKVFPGPAIWMMMVALLLNIITFVVRKTKLQYLERPAWTMPGYENRMEAEAGLPQPPANQNELPPSWESLNLASAVPIDEKKSLEAHLAEAELPSIEQRGFAV